MFAEPTEESPQALLDRVTPAIGAAFSVLLRLVPEEQTLRPVAQHQWPTAYRRWLTGLRIQVGDGPSGLAVAERRMVEVPDMHGDTVPDAWGAVARELGFSAVIAMPVLVAETPIGALAFYFTEGLVVTDAHRTLMQVAAGQLGLVMRPARRSPPPVGAQRILQG